jgi:hypothetical protein
MVETHTETHVGRHVKCTAIDSSKNSNVSILKIKAACSSRTAVSINEIA